MNNYGVLKQGNLSANHRLSIWNTYFSSKLAYPLLALSLMNKTATKKVSSQIAMSVKRCLGLNQCLEKEKLYTWLYELTPKEKAQFSLFRTVKKLISADYRIENLKFFINKISSCSKEDISGGIYSRGHKDCPLPFIFLIRPQANINFIYSCSARFRD